MTFFEGLCQKPRSQISLLVNGEVLDQVTDDSLSSGQIGFFLWSTALDEDGLDAAFDNFRLWDLGS